MNIPQFSDAKIIESWEKNARLWTDAVRKGQIESRRKVTNQAIVDAILCRSPRSVLDIGCGEGWRGRELHRAVYRPIVLRLGVGGVGIVARRTTGRHSQGNMQPGGRTQAGR